MTTSRMKLTPDKLLFVSIYFEKTRPELLNAKTAKLFKSIKEQFEYDDMLSDKQISALKNIKHYSDMAKRRIAISKGALKGIESIAYETDRKLNIVFNKIGQ